MAISHIGSAGAATTSVAIPAHVAGDLMVIYAYNNAATAVPVKPAAGGTVPTWIAIDNPAGANLNSAACMYAFAAGTTDTTGTWTSTTTISVHVLRGTHATSPIGAHAQSGNAAANSSIAPAITLQVADGSSWVTSWFGHKGITAVGAAPAGYTQRLAVAANLIIIDTLDVTTSSPGAVTQTDTSVSGGYRGQTVEFLAPTIAAPVTNWNVKTALSRSASW